MIELEPNIELKDTIYSLQRIHDQYGREGELDVILGEIATNCSVFRDLASNNRIVLTRLPDDEAEFSGAKISITNPAGPIPFTINGQEVERPQLVIAVDDNSEPRQLYSSDKERKFRPIDVTDVLKVIQFPYVRPIPVSEYDPRNVPMPRENLRMHESMIYPGSAEHVEVTTRDYYMSMMANSDLDILSLPKCDAYTLLSDIYNRFIEQNPDSFMLKMKGILPSNDRGLIGYDLAILETPPNEGRIRISDFDRDFVVSIVLSEKLPLTAQVNDKTVATFTSSEFFFQVIREGSAMKFRQPRLDRNKNTTLGTTSYLPTDETKLVLEAIIAGAQPTST